MSSLWMGLAASEMNSELVRELFDYRDGNLIWKDSRGPSVPAGSVAGTADKDGYVQICVARKLYKAHRLVWLWHGRELGRQIDHADRNPANNRIENLRLATKSQNAANSKRRCDNTSGYKGVSRSRRKGYWRATIQINGGAISLGEYPSPEKAHAAYVSAAENYFGKFARVA